MENPTVKEATKKIEELNKSTGQTWSFKAHRGTVKLWCE